MHICLIYPHNGYICDKCIQQKWQQACIQLWISLMSREIQAKKKHAHQSQCESEAFVNHLGGMACPK